MPILPGVNIPFEQLPLFILVLLVCGIVHEASNTAKLPKKIISHLAWPCAGRHANGKCERDGVQRLDYCHLGMRVHNTQLGRAA